MRPVFQVVGVCIALVTTAAACSCVPSGTVAHEYSLFDAVFLGRVVTIEGIQPPNLPRRKKVTFVVEEAFKGVAGNEMVVETGTSDADCGVGFSKGGRYLVYASRQSSSDSLAPWGVSLCSRTRSSWRAKKDLKALRKLKMSGDPGPSPAASESHSYSKYVAAASSVSHTVTSFTCTRPSVSRPSRVPASW